MTTDDLAGLLAEHRDWEWIGGSGQIVCDCGDILDSTSGNEWADFAAHQAAVIAAAGWRQGIQQFGVRYNGSGYVGHWTADRYAAEQMIDDLARRGVSTALMHRIGPSDWEEAEPRN